MSRPGQRSACRRCSRHSRTLDGTGERDTEDPPGEQLALAALCGAAGAGHGLAGDRAGEPLLRVVDPARARKNERVGESGGINVHAEVAVPPRDRAQLERLYRYLCRPGDKRAALAIAAFRAIYDVEYVCKDAEAVERQRLRAERSRPVYDKLFEWARLHRHVEPPESLLAKALGYLLNQAVALTRFLGACRANVASDPIARRRGGAAV